jgi:hypothetical protein
MALLALAFSALVLVACGSKSNETTLGGESHFLSDCGDGCEAGLECIGGVCTKECTQNDDCDDLTSS